MSILWAIGDGLPLPRRLRHLLRYANGMQKTTNEKEEIEAGGFELRYAESRR